MWPFKSKDKQIDKTNTSSVYNNPLFESVGNFAPNYIKLTGNNKIQNDALLCEYFNTITEVSAPIRRYSDQLKNIKLEFLNKNLDKLDSKERNIINIVNDFWMNDAELWLIYDLLLGNSYIQGFEQGTVETKGLKTLTNLYLLPSEFTNIELKDFQQDFRNVEVNKYVVAVGGDFKEINITDIEKVLHIKNQSTYNYTQNEVYGISRLVGCEKNIQSIASGYGARIALYDNGPRVIVTGKSQGEFAQMGNSEDVKEVQKRANDIYGRTDGQFQMMFTDVPLDVTTISLDVGELRLDESNAADFRRVCNAYNQDSKIHGDPTASTYDNLNIALSDFANGSFKSFINNRILKLNDFISQWDSDLIIQADYSGIKEIAEFEQANEAKMFEKAEKGLITRNEYLESVGQATVNLPDFNTYFVYATDGKWYPVTQIIEDVQ